MIFFYYVMKNSKQAIQYFICFKVVFVICIYYVTKNTNTPFSYMDMAKRLNLDIKYVTRAERMILELVNSKKLNLNKYTNSY